MIPLGTVAEVSTGYPFRKKVEPEADGDIVLVQLKDVGGAEGATGAGTIALRNEGGKYERYLLQAGDLLFQSRGSRHPVAVVGSGIRGIAATGLHIIRPNASRIRADYLAWWLNHPVSQDTLISKVARGQYIPFVSKADLLTFFVPVPPLEVQGRIVAIDHLQRQERALREQLDTLTQQWVDDVTFAAADRAT